MSPIIVLWFVFLVLKLTGQIDWSWWLVNSPLIVHFVLLVALSLWKSYDPVGFIRFWRGL